MISLFLASVWLSFCPLDWLFLSNAKVPPPLSPLSPSFFRMPFDDMQYFPMEFAFFSLSRNLRSFNPRRALNEDRFDRTCDINRHDTISKVRRFILGIECVYIRRERCFIKRCQFEWKVLFWSSIKKEEKKKKKKENRDTHAHREARS